MSDGISEVMEGTYFLDRSKNSEERYKKYKEIEEREKKRRIKLVKSIKDEPDIEKAQNLILEFIYSLK